MSLIGFGLYYIGLTSCFATLFYDCFEFEGDFISLKSQ